MEDGDNFSDQYVSSNSSLTQGELTHLELTFLILKCVIIITIILLAIINNILVIVSVILYRRLRHVNNYFLVSLAFADLFVALFAMTFNATVEITGQWNFGTFMCDLWNSMDVHVSTVSTLHLCCISVDRYYAIAKPLQYHMTITVKTAMVMIIMAWITPTCISFLPIFMGWYTTAEYQQHKDEHPDECRFIVNKPFAFISSSLTFWLPVVVMLTLYHRIYLEAKRHKRAIRRHSVPIVCHLGVIPSACSLGVVTPSAYSLNIMIGSTNLDKPQPNLLTSSNPKNLNYSMTTNLNNLSEGDLSSSDKNIDSPLPVEEPSSKYEAVKKAAGGRRMSDHFTDLKEPLESMKDRRRFSVQEREDYLEPKSIKNGNSSAIPLLSNSQTTPTPTHSSVSPKSTRYAISPNPFSSRLIKRRGGTSTEGIEEKRAIRSANWRKEHKAFVTLGVVMGAFLVCWLPFFLWYLTTTICGDSCPCPHIIVAILFWIGYFNSTLNPLIYMMTNHEFKEAFTNIIWKVFCCLSNKEATDSEYSGRVNNSVYSKP